MRRWARGWPGWCDGTVARPPETRQERKDRTRRNLLRASLRLLEKRSFDRLSLRQVTKEVGIVPGAFYRHFPTWTSWAWPWSRELREPAAR